MFTSLYSGKLFIQKNKKKLTIIDIKIRQSLDIYMGHIKFNHSI